MGDGNAARYLAEFIEFLMLSTNKDFHAFYVKNSRHPDFTDMAMIWPVMKWYGQSGKIPGERMIDLTNTIILNFVDHYLKEKPFENLDSDEYPELEIAVTYAPS